MLRSVDWYVVTEVSGQLRGPIFNVAYIPEERKSQTVAEAWNLTVACERNDFKLQHMCTEQCQLGDYSWEANLAYEYKFHKST